MVLSPDLAQRLGDFVQLDSQQSDGADILRIIAIGSLTAVNHHIMQMYQLGYAHPHEWSRPLPITHSNEVMRILTKRIVNTTV